MDVYRTRVAALAISCLLSSSPTFAQQTPASTRILVTIVIGNKFQEVLPENNTARDRRALIIENKNNNGDNCWVFVGSGRATKENSDKVLAPGDQYLEYWPFVPSDEIQVTCASTSDILNVEYQ
jgi:hypothetical protein